MSVHTGQVRGDSMPKFGHCMTTNRNNIGGASRPFKSVVIFEWNIGKVKGPKGLSPWLF